MKTNDMFGISEITEEMCIKGRRRPAFHIRLGWSDGVPMISEQLFVCNYKNREDCRAHAVSFRDILWRQLADSGQWPPDLTRTVPGVTNTSGTVGVRKSKQWTKVNGVPCQSDVDVWTATWSIDAQNYQCSFSEGRWGAQAYEMAYACRLAKRNIYR